MDETDKSKAIAFLKNLQNQQLCYGKKYLDTELYGFGFGKLKKNHGEFREYNMSDFYIIHTLCSFKIIWKNERYCEENYNEDTLSDEFSEKINRVIGLSVRKIRISERNDLWLDFGACWVVFLTCEGEEESWRFFIYDDDDSPHLVVSDSLMEFVY